ncbi:antirestriction protein ArdA [Candidatus Thiodiazotropha sp. CDECU1]|uniref:antirestriction protein ArdA n=1 Tax=Candidatus Thiodiazotropha sp. CDECU1 TaxID=3065865 RepID=UPI00292F52E8|nr:antirestriction protein ArdA [Candidatus Thiodiazotropha sp. CDECU1]
MKFNCGKPGISPDAASLPFGYGHQTRVLILAGRANFDGLRTVPLSLMAAACREATISRIAGDKTMTTFYAQPYSIDHTGFYFDSLEAFEAGMEKLNAKGCEEVEIQFIDGECGLTRLANAAGIGQGTVALWFEELDDLDTEQIDQLCFLLDCGFDLEDALTRYEEVCIFHGSAADYAQELIEETTDIPENLRFYIDYDAIARDMGYNGEIVEIDREVIVTNAHEF